jgi:hypothetical protein
VVRYQYPYWYGNLTGYWYDTSIRGVSQYRILVWLPYPVFHPYRW